jgi:hypothetical protein
VIPFHKVCRLMFCMYLISHPLMHYTCPTCNILLHFVALKYLLIERRNRVVGIMLLICEILGSKLRRWPAILNDVFRAVPYSLWAVIGIVAETGLRLLPITPSLIYY